MDTSGYEYLSFNSTRAINVASGSKERSFPAHRHAYGEIILVGPGDKNIYRIDDTLYSLKEGDIVLIWPMEMHGIVDADRDSSVVIQYSNTFADSLFDLKRIISHYHDLHIICINAHPLLAAKLRSIIDKIHKIWGSGKSDRELRCASLLIDLMIVLDDHKKELALDISNDGGKDVSESTLNGIINVMDYIKNNLTADDLSQSAMAERVGINKDYFSRAFRKVTGQNFCKWVNAVRVEKAVTLLAEEELSLTEVAMLAGFKSIPSFNRVFAEYKEIPPSRYRKLIDSPRLF